MDNVMVDIKALGTAPGGVIVSIGAVRFGVEQIRVYGEATLEGGECPSSFSYKGEIGETFYITIDVLDSLLAGLTVMPQTCAWWAKQDSQAIHSLTEHYWPANHSQTNQPLHILEGPSHLKEALEEFATFISGAKTIWAKGPDFDLVNLRAAYTIAGLKLPWSFRDSRDVRTALAVGKSIGAFEGAAVEKAETAHNALEDAQYQARQVIRVYEKLRKEIK